MIERADNMLFELSSENFNEMLSKASGLVVVFFYAQWCQNCGALEPILEEIAEDNFGDLNIYKLNVETNEELADKYDVFNLPTVILFNNGELVKDLAGLHSQKKVLEWLDL